MNKIFCQHCGTKHEFASIKPKYCSDCGESMGVAESKASKRKVRVEEEEDEDEDDEDYSFDSDIQIRIDGLGSNVQKFSDIYGVGEPDKYQRPSSGLDKNTVIERIKNSITSKQSVDIDD